MLNADLVARQASLDATRTTLLAKLSAFADLEGEIATLRDEVTAMAMVTDIHKGVALHVSWMEEEQFLGVIAVGDDIERFADAFPDRRGAGTWQVRVGHSRGSNREDLHTLGDGFPSLVAATEAAQDWVAFGSASLA